MADRSMGMNVFFTTEGVDALKRILGELSAQLDTLGKKDVSPSVDIDTKKATEKIGAFARELQTRIEAAVKALPGIDLKADASEPEARIAAIRAELADISSKRVGIGVDSTEADARVRELSDELKRLGAEHPNVQVRADTAEAAAKLDGLSGKQLTVGLDVNSRTATEQVGAFARDLQARVEVAVKALPAVELRAGATDVERRIAVIRTELAGLADKKIGLDVDAGQAQAQVRALASELDTLSTKAPTVQVTADATRAATALDGIKRPINELDGRRVTVDLDVATRRAQDNVGAFARDLQARVEAAVKALPNVDLKADATDMETRIAAIRVELSQISDKKVGVGLTADAAFVQIRALAKELDDLGVKSPTVQAAADTARAATSLDSIQRKLDEFTGRRVVAQVDVDTRAADARIGSFARDLQSRIEAAVRSLPAVEITATSTDVDQRIAAIRAELASLGDAHVGVGVGDVDAFTRIKALAAELDGLSQKSVDIPVVANTAKAATDLDGLKRKLDTDTGRRVVDLDANTSTASEKVGAFARDLQARVEAAIKSLPAIDLHADSSIVDQRIVGIRAELQTLADKKVGIGLTADEAFTQIHELAKDLDELSSKSGRIPIVADTAKAATDLDGFRRKVDAETGLRVPIEADTGKADTEVGAFAASLQAKVTAAVKSLPAIDVTATSTDVDQRIAAIRAELLALSRQRIGLDVDASAVHQQLSELSAELTLFSTQPLSVEAKANTARAAADLDALAHKKLTAELDVSTEKADANVGQFARKLQTSLEKAIKSLPDIELKDNSTDTEKRIREIRDELVSMADKKIGVGISTADALPRVKELAAELERLGAKNPNLQAKADTGAARAALLDLGKAADEVGNKGKAANANLGLNTALVNRWQQLGAAILIAATAAGPALLALGGVAAAGTTGLLQTGFGVKTLFSGIGTGASALQTADTQKSAQASSLAAQQVSAANSVVSAEDGVKAAIVGVTDATRAAALANTNADRAVKDSKRSVTDAITAEVDAERSAGLSYQNSLRAQASAEQTLQTAQQSELNAQQALTDARKAAQRQLEDLNLQMKDAALAEQGAVLNVQQAQLTLNTTLGLGLNNQKSLQQAQDAYARAKATGSAAELAAAQKVLDTLQTSTQGTQLQRDQAKLAYQQSLQQLEDLQVHNKQLAQDQQDATARGVDGNRQVITAQQGVTAATQATGNAQQALDVASAAVIETQRAGAESVAKAQQQVATANEALGVAQTAQVEAQRAGLESIAKANQAQVAAQRTLQGAIVQAAQVGAGAVDTLKAAMDQLSPAGQVFAHFIHDTLTPELHSIRDNVQAAGLPLMQQALVNVGTIAPLVSAGLAGTATVIGHLAVKGSEMVTSGPWRADFATIMSRNNRVLGDFGNAGLATADAFRNIAASAGPLEERLAKLAEAGAHSFDAWIQGLRNSGQLDQFFHNAGDELIQLVKVMGELATAAISLINAVHPISGVVIEIIGHLADWIGMFARANPTVIQTVAVLGTLFAILSKLTGVSIGGILKGDVFTSLASKIESAGLSAGVFAERVTGSAAAGEKVATAGETAGSAMSKFGAALPIVGVALVGVGLAYDHFITSSDNAATAMLKGGAAAEQAATQIQKQSWASTTMSGIASVLSGSIVGLTDGNDWLSKSLRDIAPSMSDVTKKAQEQLAAMDPLTRAQTQAAQAQADYSRKVEEFGPNSQQATDAQKRFADATAEASRQTQINTDGLKSNDQILAEHRDLLLGNLNGEIRVGDELATLTKGVQDHGKATDTSTDAGRRNVENLNTLTGTLNDNLGAMLKNGATQVDITKKADEYRITLFNQALQIGYTKDQAQHYVDTVLTIPPNRNTTFTNNAGIATAATQNYINSLHLAQGNYVANIIANVDPAQQLINNFIRNNEALQITLQLAAGVGAVANRPRATGGIDLVAPMAAGGFRAMDSGVANIVSPNTPTLIGDHTSVNESYIPWNRTRRTDQIFDATAVGIDRVVLPRGAPKPMADGGTVENRPRQVIAPEAVVTIKQYSTVLKEVIHQQDVLGKTTQPFAAAVMARTPTQPLAGTVVRGTAALTGSGSGLNLTALTGSIEAAMNRALGAHSTVTPPGVLGQAVARAVSAELSGAEFRMSEDGRGVLARIVNKQNRALVRR
jgi:hypothetical protein